MKTGIIILAAGSSSRMGRSKQLLNIKDKPLLLHTTEIALSLNSTFTLVVLGNQEPMHRKLIEHLPVQIVHNTKWENGMGSSLKAGVRKLIQHPQQMDNCLVLVCDQPLLTTKHLQALLAHQQTSEKDIVASFYADSAGVPALFSNKMFPALLNMADSYGAKMVIAEHMDKTETVSFEAGELDLDTEGDYQTFLNLGL